MKSFRELFFAVTHPSAVLDYIWCSKKIAKLLDCDELEVKNVLREKDLLDIEKFVKLYGKFIKNSSQNIKLLIG